MKFGLMSKSCKLKFRLSVIREISDINYRKVIKTRDENRSYKKEKL